MTIIKGQKEYKIKELCKIIGGDPAPKGNDVYSDKGTPFLKMKDLGKYHLTNNLIEIENKVSDEIAKKNNLKIVKKGCILLPRSGSVALNHRAILGVDSYMVSHICALEVIDKKILFNQFLYYYLRRISMEKITKRTTGLDAITFKDLGNIKISLPFIDDQIRIATLLSHVESLISKRKESIRLLDELIKSTFLEMFGDPVRNDKEWDTVTIGDLVREVKYGTSKSAKGGKYPYLRMNNITYDGYWDFSDLKYIDIDDSEKDKYIVQKGDLVFNRTNSKELVGKTAVYDKDDEMVIAGYLIRVRVKKGINPWFIWGHLNSKYGKAKLFNLCRNIVGMANINANELQKIKILKPPTTLQNKFAQIVEKVKSIKTKYEANLTELENLYGSLSKRAFRGELDLSRVPIDTAIKPEFYGIPNE